MSQKKRGPRNQPARNKVLAQMLFTYTRLEGPPCQGDLHQRDESPGKGEWEVRCYQDFDRALRLTAAGVPTQEINQVVWDAACHEQDAQGPRVHKTLHLCTDCAGRIVEGHLGKGPAALVLVTALVTGGSFLLVTDRTTERAAVVNGLPRQVDEQLVRRAIRKENVFDLKIQGETPGGSTRRPR